MARNRKVPPKLVEWAQERILQRLLQLISQGGLFVHTTTSPSVDARAVAVRGVRDAEMLEAFTNMNVNLSKIVKQLELITDVKLGK